MIVGLVPAMQAHTPGRNRPHHPPDATNVRGFGLGYLPQEASVFRKLSVEDNVMAILETRDDLDRAARDSVSRSCWRNCGFGQRPPQPGPVAVGRRAAPREIARALAAEPRFMLLDEPFAGVDPLSRPRHPENHPELTSRDIGVLITDHNVRETLGVAKPRLHRKSGHRDRSRSAEEILANPQSA